MLREVTASLLLRGRHRSELQLRDGNRPRRVWRCERRCARKGIARGNAPLWCEQIDAFVAQVNKAIAYAKAEYSLTLAAVIGALEIIKLDLYLDQIKPSDD